MGLTHLGALEWGLLVLVVLPLLQFPLVVYLSRCVETDEEPACDHAVEFRADCEASPNDPQRGTDSRADRVQKSRSRDAHIADSSADPPRTTATPPSVTCPACGTENDPAFSYCRFCVERLTSPHPASDPRLPRTK